MISPPNIVRVIDDVESIVLATGTEDCMEHGIASSFVSTADKNSTNADGKSKSSSSLPIALVVGLAMAAVIVVVVASHRTFQMGVDITASMSSRRLQSKPVTVGAYYYPWHGNNFHNGDGFIRQDLEPPQLPELGKYDDTDPKVIEQHLEWSKQANINLWVTSWWSPRGSVDSTTKNVIMQHEKIGDMKIALHYETLGRVREIEDYDTKRVGTDMEYICDTYFGHDNYYRINGRPVVFIYLSRYMSQIGKIAEVAAIMRTAANKCGESVYLVGDHSFRGAPSGEKTFESFQYLDSVTNYDLYGGMRPKTSYAGAALVDKYYDGQVTWRERAAEHGCGYVSAAAPGYNDRGVRLDADHIALSRRLSEDDVEGSLFEYALGRARDIVDESADNLIMINSFNEWHEDTQVEPVAVTAEGTSLPEELTNGVSYHGYGTLYLDILSARTTGYIPPYFSSSRAYESS